MSRLVIRADGGQSIGSGHLARCLALAQAWGGEAILVTTGAPDRWVERYRREGVEVVEPDADVAEGDWAVVDGYLLAGVDARQWAPRVLGIDDHGTAGYRDADLILDQNLDATADPYPDAPDVLIGTRYALLRKEFRSWHGWEREIPGRARRLLVALGGSPPAAVRALAEETLAQLALADLDVTVLDGIEDVPAAMAAADLALTASGSTCWELCCLGLPSVLLAIAPNQEPLATAMVKHGAADHPGWLDELSPPRLAAAVAELAADRSRRRTMSEVGRSLVDGRGARRVVTRMRAELLTLRPAVESDARLLWEWANEPGVRAASFNSEPIPWDDHVRWFAGRLRDPHCHVYLSDAGQVRFDGNERAAEISVSVPAALRGQGWGPALIDAGVRRLFAETGVETVIARIKPENQGSRSAFEDADFVLEAETPTLSYVRQRMVN